jgi:hypothetical protein
MIERVIGAFNHLGFDLDDTEIADILWLAVQMRRCNPSPMSELPQEIAVVTPEIDPNSKLPGDRQKIPPKSLTKTETSANVYPQSSQNSNETSSGYPIKVPAAQALRNKLDISRSLKPLKRRVPSRSEFILDEIATVERIAEEKLLLPVMCPARDRWLELALVIDEGTSMFLWQQTIKEFKQLLERHGAFRDVRTWGLFTDKDSKVWLRPRIGSVSRQKRLHNPRELIDPNGRRLFIIISDCVSPPWYNGAITKTLAAWASTSPTTIIQVLPEWLWERSALGVAESILLRSLAPGVPNQQLIMTALDLLDEFDVCNRLKIPVVTLEPESLKNWARMVAGAGEVQTKGFLLAPDGEIFDVSSESTENSNVELTAKQRLQRFRLTASPMARKLAGLLAAAPVSLPVVRLIQQTMLQKSSQVHVAEVFLGGILKPLSAIAEDGAADKIQFDFADGVRDLLLDGVPLTESTEVLRKVSEYVAARLRLSVDDFTAMLVNPGLGDGSSGVLVRPFAQITAKVLRRLGGKYAELAEEMEQSQYSYETHSTTVISQSSINPFVVGKPVPPDRFVGRESEIAAAFDQIYNRSHLAIWGGPGMGKTSFLQKLESLQTWQDQGIDSSQAVIVRFSCESIVPFSPSKFWGEILNLLKEKLEGESALQAEIDTILQTREKIKDSLRQVLRKLGRQGKYLVLLIDDFDVALDTNEEYDEDAMQRFLSECRNSAVHSAEGQHLSMIVTSLKRLNELGPKFNPNASPWYNHYLFLQLKTFNNSEIDSILQILRIPDLREAIKENTGGHPSLLQISGFLLYRDLLTANAPSIDKFVSDFESGTQQIYQNIWNRCSEVEQTLLMLMALSALKGRLHKQKQFDVSGIELIFSQRERELIKLEEQGVVTHIVDEEKKFYSFTSSTMERWVIQELRQTDDKWLQAREKLFLNLMSRQHLEKLNTTIKWLWKNQDKIPQIMEWFGKLATFQM